MLNGNTADDSQHCCTTGFTSLQFQNQKNLGHLSFFSCSGSSSVDIVQAQWFAPSSLNRTIRPWEIAPGIPRAPLLILHRPSALYNHIHLSKAAVQLQPGPSFQLSKWLYKVQSNRNQAPGFCTALQFSRQSGCRQQ